MMMDAQISTGFITLHYTHKIVLKVTQVYFIIKIKIFHLTGSARKSKEGRNTEPDRISLISNVRDLEIEIIILSLVIVISSSSFKHL